MITAPAVRLVAHGVLAVTGVLALALLVGGHAGSGDGFSAGLTAGLGVAIHFLLIGEDEGIQLFPMRYAVRIAGAGLLCVLGPVFVPLALGRPPVAPLPPAGTEPPAFGALSFTSGFVLDLGVALLVIGLIAGGLRAIAMTARREEAET